MVDIPIERSLFTASVLDVDECVQGNECEQLCTNTPGRYRCDCFEGFIVKDLDKCEPGKLPTIISNVLLEQRDVNFHKQ